MSRLHRAGEMPQQLGQSAGASHTQARMISIIFPLWDRHTPTNNNMTNIYIYIYIYIYIFIYKDTHHTSYFGFRILSYSLLFLKFK